METHESLPDWEQRIAATWNAAATADPDEIVRRIEELVRERPADDPAALFELASAYDSAGREHDAESLYRRALAGDLDDARRAQLAIQFGSTLRNVGRLEESLQVLTDASERGPNPVTGDAATAFRALTLIDLGREREAALNLLRALTPHLPRYHRSLFAYIDALENPDTNDD
jgi:tetratricopeptide (TPR) repeat protein